MRLFSRKHDIKDYTIIIGCGRVGANLANTLSEAGENVLILDEREDAFLRLSDSFGGLSVTGDGTDLDMLNQVSIQRASSLIAVTQSDNTNILIAQLARDHFQVPRVIARLYDPERERIYQELGIQTFCPATLSAEAIHGLLEVACG